MKRIGLRYAGGGLVVVLTASVIFWGVFVRKVLAAHVTLSWAYDYGPVRACSATRTTDCIDHFEILDVTHQEKGVLIQSVANPEAAAGKVDKISTEFKYGPPFGERTLSVIAVARDGKGYLNTSTPYAARVTVLIRPHFRLTH